MDDELKVSAGPAGISAESKGSQTIYMLMAALLGAWVWYLSYNHEAKAEEKSKAQIVAYDRLTEEIKKMTAANAAAAEQQEKVQRATIYVLSLTQAQREKLNLVRPEILYEMQGIRRER